MHNGIGNKCDDGDRDPDEDVVLIRRDEGQHREFVHDRGDLGARVGANAATPQKIGGSTSGIDINVPPANASVAHTGLPFSCRTIWTATTTAIGTMNPLVHPQMVAPIFISELLRT
jgi:hypothetical protein